MRYQLPQAAQTNKLMNLPADLLALAEEALAKKFDLPEIVTEKPKPKVKPVKKQVSPEALRGQSTGDMSYRERREMSGYQNNEHIITVSVQSSQRRMSPPSFSMMMEEPQMRFNPAEEVRIREEMVWFHESVCIPRHIPHREVEYILDSALRRLVERVQRQARGPRGDMTMSCDGYTYPINCRQDISRFIERELR